jgi:hypothetical protein
MKKLFKEFYRLGRIVSKEVGAKEAFRRMSVNSSYSELTRHARTNLYNMFYHCRQYND